MDDENTAEGNVFQVEDQAIGNNVVILDGYHINNKSDEEQVCIYEQRIVLPEISQVTVIFIDWSFHYPNNFDKKLHELSLGIIIFFKSQNIKFWPIQS
jgi:hypothetical protein